MITAQAQAFARSLSDIAPMSVEVSTDVRLDGVDIVSAASGLSPADVLAILRRYAWQEASHYGSSVSPNGWSVAKIIGNEASKIMIDRGEDAISSAWLILAEEILPDARSWAPVYGPAVAYREGSLPTLWGAIARTRTLKDGRIVTSSFLGQARRAVRLAWDRMRPQRTAMHTEAIAQRSRAEMTPNSGTALRLDKPVNVWTIPDTYSLLPGAREVMLRELIKDTPLELALAIGKAKMEEVEARALAEDLDPCDIGGLVTGALRSVLTEVLGGVPANKLGARARVQRKADVEALRALAAKVLDIVDTMTAS